MMEEIGMIARGAWKRRNGVMRAISIASITVNVVMLVLSKRSIMGGILVDNYVEVRSFYMALVHIVTSHPSLQRPLFYLLFNILLIFPLLLQSGLLSHHHHQCSKYSVTSNSNGNSFTVVTTTSTSIHNHIRLPRRHGHMKHTSHDYAATSREHNHSSHSQRSHNLKLPHDLNYPQRSGHGHHTQPHRFSNTSPSHVHPTLQQQGQTSSPLGPNVVHPYSQRQHHQMGNTVYRTENTGASEDTRAKSSSHAMTGVITMDSVNGGTPPSTAGDQSDMLRDMASTEVRVKRDKKSSLFTIEPLEDASDAKPWLDEMVPRNAMLYMCRTGEEGKINSGGNMGDGEEEQQLSSNELNEKAEKFIRKFKKNLMEQRQDSFNRLLALLRSA